MTNQKRRRRNGHHREGTERVDPVQLEAGLHSTEEEVRARAVRSLCPCRSGWEVFESHLDVVNRLRRDPSPKVQANVLHLFEDAREMQSEAPPTSKAQVRNEMLRTRQQSRFRADLDELAEAAANREQTRQKSRRGRYG
jgi:hypothetical protein